MKKKRSGRNPLVRGGVSKSYAAVDRYLGIDFLLSRSFSRNSSADMTSIFSLIKSFLFLVMIILILFLFAVKKCKSSSKSLNLFFKD